MAALDVNFNYEEGVDMGGILGLFRMPEEDHQLADDVLKFFGDNNAETGPTSSSSDGTGSSARGEATPHSSSFQHSLSNGSAASSWAQMAPQLASLQNAGPASAPAMYSMSTQQTQPQYNWQQAVAWHPAFPAEGSVQQTSKESKITVSHSTIEKQRRDRINSLIDELRELVPPSASVKGPDGGDIKRPKHVVLSDTIALLRHLKEKVQQDELERQRLQLLKQQLAASGMAPEPVLAPVSSLPAGAAVMPMPMTFTTPCTGDGSMAGVPSAQAAQSLLQHSLSGSLPSQAVAAATAAVCGPNVTPELPQAPSHLPSAVGVLVEEGPGSFLVKVSCKDRHGLLSDIANALCSLPLQVTRAAITTSNGGAVYDVFEIIAEPSLGHEPVTALDVQYHVHQALYKWKSAQPNAEQVQAAAGKRLRL